MKALTATGLLALLAIAFSSCMTTEGLARNQAATTQWLAANAGKPTFAIDGNWHAQDWGNAYLRETNGKVTGHIAEYPVRGVVNEDTLYLAVEEDGVTENTIVVRMTAPGVLEGYYSDRVPFDEGDQEPVRFVRSAR